jgi:putative mRNA 3-end processing factor
LYQNIVYILESENMALLVFDNNGIYCPQAQVYIDPWRPVQRAVITHAHVDHAKWGNQYYLAHLHTVPVLQARLGAIHVEALEYNEVVVINGVSISLHPAGHVIGSAQVRLEYQGEVWVVSGDYKLQNDGLSTPFEPVKCHNFITESTFGLPAYRFPEPDKVHHDINEWWKNNQKDGKVSLLTGYSLGKAQRLLKHLDPSIGKIFVHGAVENMNTVFRNLGFEMPQTVKVSNLLSKSDYKQGLVLAPPSVVGSSWLKRFEPISVGIASGWMQLRGARRRQNADRGFILSDHADWDALNKAVLATEAENIFITHGYKSALAKWLTEKYGLNALEVETLYEGESLQEEEITDKKDEEIR